MLTDEQKQLELHQCVPGHSDYMSFTLPLRGHYRRQHAISLPEVGREVCSCVKCLLMLVLMCVELCVMSLFHRNRLNQHFCSDIWWVGRCVVKMTWKMVYWRLISPPQHCLCSLWFVLYNFCPWLKSYSLDFFHNMCWIITHYFLRTDLFPVFRLASSKTDLATWWLFTL